LYQAEGNWADAERVLLRLVSYAPDYADGWDLLLYQYIRTGEIEKARQVADKLARLKGLTENSVQVYIDLISDTEKKQAAVENLIRWSRLDRYSPADPSLLPWSHEILLAAAGAWPEARIVLKEAIEKYPVYRYGGTRVDRTIAAFNCSAETQAIYAASGLPELVVPYPCDELLK
ncbi:MAG: hypothetical protein HQ492_10345, partial [Woeseiaceae bacterium]|nr:hypothetical protein [Woeseiaceae bacterium]